MACASKSLRLMVDHWLAPNAKLGVRVVEYMNNHAKGQRYVRVKALGSEADLEIYFFRHSGGLWCIYPPMAQKLTMAVE